MGRKVQVFGEHKELADCTQQDIEALSRGAAPARVVGGPDATTEGAYARLLQEMEAADAETVGDLGEEKVSRWQTALGLQYVGAADLLGRLDEGGQGGDDDAAS